MADQYNSAHTGAEIDQAVSDVQNNKDAWSSKPQPSATTPKAPGTASAGSESAYARGDHVHPEQTVHDNDVLWGGKNLSGEVSPMDAAMVSVIGGNKFALCKSQGITVEYTNDGGVTWADYDATEKTKIELISGISTVGLYYGKKTESSQIVTADDMLRITVNAWNCGVYTSLRKILIEFATSGSTNDFVKIESATIGDPEIFTVVGTYNVSGNSGWNSIPYSNNFGAYSLNQTYNVGVLRFTFSTGTASSYRGRPYVQNLILNGITNYVNPSKLSATGHLYSYDYQQNATFPANVTAEKFIGDGSKLINIPYPPKELPNVTASDNGKSAVVVNGAWAAVDKTPFYVNCTISGYGVYDEEVTHDKTYAEILAAYQAGRPCYAVLKDSAGAEIIRLPLTDMEDSTDAQEATFALVQMVQGDEPETISAYYVTISTDYAEGRWWSYNGVPYVAESDEGKFLRVVNGAWQAATVPDANGGSF